ncbi:MAG: inositol monophosphatase family protein [Mycobacterium sp.]
MPDSPRAATLSDDLVVELRDVARRLAAEAAEFVRRRRVEVFGDASDAGPAADAAADSVRTKSTPTDPVTVVDTETERLLRDRLEQLRPGDAVLGEEGGGPADGVPAGSITWVLDPIDGTVNFVYGIPAYGVSIAAQVDGVSVAGAVADVVSGEVYYAALGHGAAVEGPAGRKDLRCNPVDNLSMALLGTGFGYKPSRRAAQAVLLSRVMPSVRDVRRIGSAALDLCMVAAGRLDLYYEHRLNVWDWAAGALVAAEAGAQMMFPTEPTQLLVAAAPGVAEEFHAVLAGLGALEPIEE